MQYLDWKKNHPHIIPREQIIAPDDLMIFPLSSATVILEFLVNYMMNAFLSYVVEAFRVVYL